MAGESDLGQPGGVWIPALAPVSGAVKSHVAFPNFLGDYGISQAEVFLRFRIIVCVSIYTSVVYTYLLRVSCGMISLSILSVQGDLVELNYCK